MPDTSLFADGIPVTSTGEPHYDLIIAQIKTLIAQITVSLNPSYSVEGHSYSKGEYLEILGRQLEQMTKLRAQAHPFEIISRGY